MTNDVKDLSKELAELESAIAEPDLAPTDQVKLRERHAFVALRLAEIEAAAPYADTSTEDLQAQAETGELEREDARLAWESAKASRGDSRCSPVRPRPPTTPSRNAMRTYERS